MISGGPAAIRACVHASASVACQVIQLLDNLMSLGKVLFLHQFQIIEIEPETPKPVFEIWQSLDCAGVGCDLLRSDSPYLFLIRLLKLVLCVLAWSLYQMLSQEEISPK